jgi:hypothetical protein
MARHLTMRRALVAVPVMAGLLTIFLSATPASASNVTIPVVDWMAPLGVYGAATESEILSSDEPAGYVVGKQAFSVEEAEGPDGGSTAYTVKDSYFELTCSNASGGLVKYRTKKFPGYTVPADPQEGILEDLNPTYYVTGTVRAPAKCGTPTGLLAGVPDATVWYCETTPGYWRSVNHCGGSVLVSIVSKSKDLPSAPGFPSTSGTDTLYAVVSDSELQSIESTGQFSESASPGVYFYNSLNDADQVYGLYGAGYGIVQATAEGGSLGVQSVGYIQGLTDVAFDYIASNSLSVFYDIIEVGVTGEANHQ